MDVSSTAEAVPIDHCEGPHSDRQTVLPKTRKDVKSGRIVVGEPMLELALLHNCILAVHRMSEAVVEEAAIYISSRSEICLCLEV